MGDKNLVTKSNLSALKEAWNKKNQKNVFKYWKPQADGRYRVRFLPPSTSNGLFYKEVAQHRIGDSYYFCPKVEGDRCPVCEYYKSLYDTGKDDKIVLAKEIKPRKQYLYNIVVREEEGKPSEDQTKVNVYMSGKTLFDCLMDYFFDDDYGDLTDVVKGYDFVIVKEAGDLGFPNYKKSKPRKEPSPLADNAEDIEKVLSNIHNLDKEVEFKSYEELKNVLQAFLDQKDNSFSAEPKASKQIKDDSDDESSARPSKPASKSSSDDDMEEFEKELLSKLNG